MKTRKKMFWCLMLTVLCHCLCAQTPRIEVTGTDTMAVVPIQNIRIANTNTIELKQCREENDSLGSQIRTYTGLTNNLRSSITELKQANSLNASIINDKDKIIDLCGEQLRKEARKNKILKLERNGSIAAFLAVLVKIAFFH